MSTPNIRHIFDFSDKLNPMLVKELRQGLRGISFVVLFIAIQAFLALILLTTAAGASYENAGHLLSRIIFFFFSVAVLIVQPLRGITALSIEIKGKTIDLLCLTNLSTWRITYGKWISIVSQSGLILTAIFPYLILRYFFGNMHIFSELLFLFSLFLLSATFTAITVGLSGINSLIIRVLLPIAASFYVFAAIAGAFMSGRHSFQQLIELTSLNSMNGALIYLGFVIACIYTTWMSLDLGTCKIAPVSENRATPKRLVSLFLISGALLLLGIAGVEPAIIIGLGLCFSLPICALCLTEDPHLVAPITAPFVRKGLAGRIAGRLLYPGWATGVIFCLLLFAIMHLTFAYIPVQGGVYHDNLLIAINGMFAMLFLSVVLTRIFVKKHPNRLGLLLLFIASQWLIVALVVAAEEWADQLTLLPYFCWLPSSLLYLEKAGFDTATVVMISTISVASYGFMALSLTLPIWKQITQVEHPSISP